MKNSILLSLAFLVISMSANAQVTLTAQMDTYYLGHPKKVTQTNAQGTIVSTYDRNGHAISKVVGEQSINYSWLSDEEVKLEMKVGGRVVEEGYAYINEMTDEVFDYDMGDINIRYTFTQNGVINTLEMSSGDQRQVTEYVYSASSDIFPQKVITKMGGMSQEIKISVSDFDRFGNPKTVTQSANGLSITSTLSYEYYD